ncbi:MAG: hypothetical protein ABL893_15075 [Hyphomicrobium sp.]
MSSLLLASAGSSAEGMSAITAQNFAPRMFTTFCLNFHGDNQAMTALVDKLSVEKPSMAKRLNEKDRDKLFGADSKAAWLLLTNDAKPVFLSAGNKGFCEILTVANLSESTNMFEAALKEYTEEQGLKLVFYDNSFFEKRTDIKGTAYSVQYAKVNATLMIWTDVAVETKDPNSPVHMISFFRPNSAD